MKVSEARSVVRRTPSHPPSRSASRPRKRQAQSASNSRPTWPRTPARSCPRRSTDPPLSMTRPRIVVPGATLALCRRTNLRKAFLADWDPLIDEIFLYALADAQRHTGVAIHSAVRVATHYHIQVTLSEANLGEFLRRVNGDISRAVNALLKRSGYDTPGAIFDHRPTHAMRLIDAAAQLAQLVYDHVNPVAAGLVAHTRHSPGRPVDHRGWKAGVLKVRRPGIYFSSDRPETLFLKVTPPPLLLDAFGGSRERAAYELGRLSNAASAAIRRTRHWRAAGPQLIRRVHPWSEPRTFRSDTGQPSVRYKIGEQGAGGRRLRARAKAECRAWLSSYDKCLAAFRDGDRAVRFPFGCYQAPRVLGVAVADPDPEAIVARPETHEDRPGSPERLDGPTVRRYTRPCFVSELRATFEDNAGSLVGEAELEFFRPPDEEADVSASDSRRSSAPQRRRGATAPTANGAFQVSRVVTLRGRNHRRRSGATPVAPVSD